MKVEAVAPEEFLGDIIGGLNGRRATIRGMEMRPGNAQAVNATVPLGEMFGYATELRSATQGRGRVFNGIRSLCAYTRICRWRRKF